MMIDWSFSEIIVWAYPPRKMIRGKPEVVRYDCQPTNTADLSATGLSDGALGLFLCAKKWATKSIMPR
jgi:hypothetical protein